MDWPTNIKNEALVADTLLAVPTALAGISCVGIQRLWILQKTSFENCDAWEIVDETGIVGCGEIKENGREVRLLRNARIVGPVRVEP